jgi:hypothetical protein
MGTPERDEEKMPPPEGYEKRFGPPLPGFP